MSVKSHELWKLLECKAKEEEPSTVSQFTDAVWQVCKYGIDLSSTIRDTFRTYTLHDETHICNVMTIMLKLVGELKSNLTRNECAMLIMAACCHDIGMSVTDEEKAYLRGCPDRMQTYLEKHPSDYNIAYQHGLCEGVTITDEILQHYIRANHHKRVSEQLQNIVWPEALGRSINIGNLISVCQSHGEDATIINQLPRSEPNLDLLFCAVLLRLGDILDFDATRAPDALFRYINLAHLDGIENEISRAEWQKHQASRGFIFSSYNQHNQHILFYRAECTNIRVEQSIISYLDWVDAELTACGKLIRYMEPRWHTLMLPGQVHREITARGYLSGAYKLTLDQERVLDLLVGRELYSDPAVFVRELIQNAIDAVRTRKQLDKNLPRNWTPQINIRTWVDDEGFHWFRIEDNGIGMTEQTIREYFLKVGCSYYNSDQFRADKIRCGADLNYKPISQFGIGILSCFMSDPKNNRVEVSTKHFMEDGKRYPAYRLSIQGINGYYYVANDEYHRTMAVEMPDYPKSSQAFISNPGTVIAVRSNPYQSGSVQSFKDIIDKYVLYPEIPIHYEGIEGVSDYKTEQDFVTAIEMLTPRNEDGTYQPVERIPIPEQYFLELEQKYPELVWEEKPYIAVYCLPLHYFTNNNPLIQGAIVFAQAEGGKINWNIPGLEEKYFPQATIWIHNDFQSHSPEITTLFKLSPEAHVSFEKNFLPAFKSELQRMDMPLDLDVNTDFSTYQILSVASMVNLQGELGSIIRAYNIEASSGLTYPFPELYKQLPWFKRWFDQHIPKSYEGGGVYIIAHNGIYAGVFDDLLFDDFMVIYTILILKDDYRPILDLSRNHIQNLPLKVTCSLDALADCICYSLKFSNLRVHKNNTFNALSPTKDYLDILNSPPFSLSNLYFFTNLGALTLSGIELALRTQEKLELKGLIQDNFHIVVLLQRFDLRILFSQKQRTSIYILEKRNAAIQEQLSAFPPGLFIPPLTGDVTHLGVYFLFGDNYCSRIPYNASHPFSEWVIKNRAILQNSVLGMYNQIIKQLQDGENLIENINASLARLRQIPHLGIEIPGDLTIDDFLVIGTD